MVERNGRLRSWWWLAVAVVVCLVPSPAAANLVDLAITSVAPVGTLRHGGACNEVTVQVVNQGPDAIVLGEDGLLELTVWDSLGTTKLWAPPYSQLQSITGMARGDRRTFTIKNVVVPTAALGSGQMTTVGLRAQIHVGHWHIAGETDYRNNVFQNFHWVKLADRCTGGGGGGGNEPPPDNPDLARQAFSDRAVMGVFHAARCTTCHAGTPLPPGGTHPTMIAGHPITPSDCATCHRTPSPANPLPGSVRNQVVPVPLPSSNRSWLMAPSHMSLSLSMSAHDICEQVKRNSAGANDREKALAVVAHINEDDLVKWAFTPLCSIADGTGTASGPCASLTAAPTGHMDFVRRLTEWANHGGACPP